MRKIYISAAIILLAIASCTKKAAPTTAAQPHKPAIDAAPIFAANCARCHGATGVEGRAPNLSLTTLGQSDVASVISNGQGHMPAFAGKLNQQQIDALADFVLHIKK